MNPDLVSSPRYRVAFEQRTISFFIVPNFLELSCALFWLVLFVDQLFHILGVENAKNPILMGEADDWGCQKFFLKGKISFHPCIVHLFHRLVVALLVEFKRFLFTFRQYNYSCGQPVQSVQNVQVFSVHLVMKDGQQCVVVVPTSRMHDHARWLHHNQKIFIFVHDGYGQVQDWRLTPESGMGQQISVFDDVLVLCVLVVDFDIAIIDGFPEVLLVVGFELLDEEGEEGLSEPALFGVGLEEVLVGFDEAKGGLAEVVGLFVVIELHK